MVRGDKVIREWNNVKADLSLSCMIHDFIRGMERFIMGYRHCHSLFSSILLLCEVHF